MSQLLLGIDIGTYSSKGILCRPDGTIIAKARADHEMSTQNRDTPSMMRMLFGGLILGKSQKNLLVRCRRVTK